VAIFNLPLALLTAWLLWQSRAWPLAGDATIFHFIAVQMHLGAVPYRDIVDVNMPLTYGIHALAVTVAGLSDIAWRAFDLTAAAILAALILMLLAPVGRAVAILAVLVVLLMHVLLGPYSAGQRDFLMCIPMVAAALLSARAAQHHDRRLACLLLAGALGMSAACIKPTGILLLALPSLALPLHTREILSIVGGAAAVALAVFGSLAAWGGLGAFVAMLHDLLPDYASMGAVSVPDTLKALQWLGPVAGLALAAALGIAQPKPPRLRLMIGLMLFGLIHLLAQRKGWSYHIYPLAIGLACWGAWTLAALARWQVAVCLTVIAAILAWLIPNSSYRVENDPSLQATAAMQSALESHLPRGARVQMLDADNGAFLAMARAGMRQATPHVQWFSLLIGKHPPRREFLRALEADPPAAVLLTNAEWPLAPGFEAADSWPELNAFLSSRYDLIATGHHDYIDWRLYLVQGSAISSQASGH
jgi:hypothetical protein